MELTYLKLDLLQKVKTQKPGGQAVSFRPKRFIMWEDVINIINKYESENMEENKQQTELNAEQPNSVEISINAKGQYSGKVKVYASTIDEAMQTAVLKAKQLEELIRSKNN